MSNTALAELVPKVQREHAYVAGEKTFCIYLAEDEAAMHEHAKISGFPVSRITLSRRSSIPRRPISRPQIK